MLSSWQKCFREGFAPCFSTKGLRALLVAVENDDPTLLQCATTQPPPLMSVVDWPVEACCAVCYPFWAGDGLITVGELEEAFAEACYQCDQNLGEPVGSRHFLSEFDTEDRKTFFPKLREEILFVLAQREEAFQEGFLCNGPHKLKPSGFRPGATS